MKILEPLKKFRQRIADTRHETTNADLWSHIWSRSSTELRFELAAQIAANAFPSSNSLLVNIDDPMLISELVTINSELVDVNGEPVTFKSVIRTVTLGMVAQTITELSRAPEVRHAIEVAAARRAEEIAPELEKVVRATWGNHIKVRTRSRFIIEGFVQMPDSGTALNVLILESSGHTSRELLPIERSTAQSIRTVTDKFEKFPSIILALGAKVEREIWVIPQHAVELPVATHRL